MFTEIEAHRDAVTWQPSLLAIDEPDFDPALAGARRRFLGRGAWVDVVPGMGHRRRRALRHRARVGAVEGVRAADVRPGRRRAPARDAACGTTGPRCSSAWPAASGAATASGSRRSPPTSTATGATPSRGTATASATPAPTRWWRSCRSGRRARCCCAPTAAARRSRFPMHSGDLLVQGGTCQRTFEHCVPKRAHAGPRISVMFRQQGGN